METAIRIFAWIGIGTTALLVIPTLLIWACWVWQQSLEYGCRMLGMLYGTSFYCALVLNKDKAGVRKAAGRLLYARYQFMKEREPEIALEFEKELGWRLSQEISQPPTNAPNPESE
jgi:hypothetical protein